MSSVTKKSKPKFNKQNYYKQELFRTMLYPFVFVIIAVILVHVAPSTNSLFRTEDLGIYIGVSVVGLLASLILYLVTYKHPFFSK